MHKETGYFTKGVFKTAVNANRITIRAITRGLIIFNCLLRLLRSLRSLAMTNRALRHSLNDAKMFLDLSYYFFISGVGVAGGGGRFVDIEYLMFGQFL